MTECHKKVLGRQRKAAKANHPQSKTTNKHNATKAILDSERTKGDTESANGEEAKDGSEAGPRSWIAKMDRRPGRQGQVWIGRGRRVQKAESRAMFRQSSKYTPSLVYSLDPPSSVLRCHSE